MDNTNLREHGRFLHENTMFPDCVDIGAIISAREKNPPAGLLRQINFEVHILTSIEPHGFKK